jgi:hypothetical protein
MVKPFEVKRLLDRIRALLGLEWLEDDAGQDPVATVEPRPLHTPDRDHLEELLRLGRIGYVRGIEGKLDQLDADPRFRDFVGELRGHLRNFDFRRYTAFLERVVRDG